MTNDFEAALDFVFKHECVFERGHYGDFSRVISENVSGDAGGLTKWGIDQRSHPEVDIEGLSKEEAADIYREEYWEANKCQDMPWPVSFAHFDNCVNMGATQAAKLLQRVIGTLDDGKIGPATRLALSVACRVRGAKTVALQVVNKKREFYKSLVEQKPALAKFKDGWLNRTNNLEKLIA